MIKMLLIQLIGAVGYTSIALSYYKKKKEEILLVEIIAYLFFTIHFYLLSGITGAICNLIGLFALLVLYLFDKYHLRHKILMAMIFVIGLLVINIVTFQNIFSIFPMIASIIAILSFLSNNENYIRVVGIISAICWLIYGIAYKSYISIAFQIFTFFNVCTALYQNIDLKKQKHK